MYTICLCSILRFFWNLLRSYDPKCQILQQLMTKLVHSNFGDNNPAPFPLWWTEAMLKHKNVSKILWGVKGWKKTMLYSCLFSVFFFTFLHFLIFTFFTFTMFFTILPWYHLLKTVFPKNIWSLCTSAFCSKLHTVHYCWHYCWSRIFTSYFWLLCLAIFRLFPLWSLTFAFSVTFCTPLFELMTQSKFSFKFLLSFSMRWRSFWSL